MSSISRLSVQGIRSFGSAAEDCQKIEFAAPLTLIVGDNGCGKTTIIECLKYALTGDFPPGSDRGKSFVHDPKIFSQVDTMAQITLEVKNIVGNHLTICRSMKISHRRIKSTFETMDSTIVYPGESISKRVADADATMSQFMGVSKAIINNVLFCHQEESNWPLEEAKKLKEKFDAIFGISEYNKAIEKMIKMRKEEMDELKVKEANLKHLAYLKQEMDDKSMSLQQAQEKSIGVQQAATSCDDDMKPLDARLLEIREIEYEVGKNQARKVELDTNLKNSSEQLSALGQKIKKPYMGTLAELDRELTGFGELMAAKQLQYRNLEGEVSRWRSKQQQLQEHFIAQDKELHACKQQRQQQQKCEAEHGERVELLAGNLDLHLGDAITASARVAQLQTAMQREKERIEEAAQQHERDDQQRQAAIDQLRVDLTKLEESALTLRKQQQQTERESGELKQKIEGIERTTHELQRLRTELTRVEQMHDDLSARFNQQSLRDEMAAAKAQVQARHAEFQQLDERLTILSALSKVTAELAIKRQEHEKRQQEVRRVRSKHGDSLRRLFGTEPKQNYRRQLQQRYEKLRADIKDLGERSSEQQLKQQSCEIQRKSLKDEMTRAARECDEAKERIYEQCRGASYEELLTKCQTTVSQQQLEVGALRSAANLYKRYIERLQAEPCCPLCTTILSGERAGKLADDLTEEIQQQPANIERATAALELAQKRYTQLLQLRPLIERVAQQDEQLPQRKQQLERVQDELSDCGSLLETLQLAMAQPTSELELANSMLGDMSLLDEALKDVDRLGADIAALSEQLPENFAAEDASVEALQTQKRNVSRELETERARLEQQQRDYEKTSDGLNLLREKKNSLKDRQIGLQEGIQSLPQLKERLEELSVLTGTLQLELQQRQGGVQPLKQQLSGAIAQKERLKETNRKQLAQQQAKWDTNSHIARDIQRLQTAALAFEQQQLPAEITRLQFEIEANASERNAVTEQLTQIGQSLELLKLECLDQAAVERDLKDNRELMVLRQKVAGLQAQQEQLSHQLGDLDFTRMSLEKQSLIKQRDAATVRKGELLGQLGEIQDQIKRLKDAMTDPKYKDALHNYRVASYEVDIAKGLIEDFGQYRLALEWALIKFHAEKMEKINRLIREYWRLIYQGSDIDYIQVQTDELKTDGNAADRRRSYNYRVIQSKNNMEIDMRGRCSAGQRVLACLIIRMALAETFGSSCGVFALDEPTTNLDRKNIISLCDALNRIIEERQVQTNFMLIIITHDEEFISTLGKISSYHRVLLNSACKSVIRKVDVGYT